VVGLVGPPEPVLLNRGVVRLLLVILLLSACGSGRSVLSGPQQDPDGGPVVIRPAEFPAEITGLLSASEADSCGVCVREKRAEAFALAEVWFAPGTLVRSDGSQGWRVLDGGEMELYFPTESGGPPRLTFRFHTDEGHLVGVEPGDFTDPDLAARVLSRPVDAVGTATLEVVAFAYGTGPSFRFDAARNRIQVQCRVVEDDGPALVPRTGRYGTDSRGR
jgi:hypothetical protein